MIEAATDPVLPVSPRVTPGGHVLLDEFYLADLEPFSPIIPVAKLWIILNGPNHNRDCWLNRAGPNVACF